MTTDQHVTDLLFDYLEGRVAAGETASIESHLARCPECAAVFRTGRELRADVMERGARHLAPERLVELAGAEPGGGGGAAPGEEAHLAGCARCREELGWLRELPAPPRRARVIPITRAWGWSAVGLAAAAGLLFTLMARGPSVDSRVVALARIAPIAVEETRGGAAGEAYALGLQRYLARDWAGATAALREVAAAEPEHEAAALLLGSALLLSGEPEAAARELARAAAVAGDPAVAEEARWQLANALLAAGDARGARGALEPIAAGGGGYALAAREQLARLPSP